MRFSVIVEHKAGSSLFSQRWGGCGQGRLPETWLTLESPLPLLFSPCIHFPLCHTCLKKQTRRPSWSHPQIGGGPPDRLGKRFRDSFQSSPGAQWVGWASCQPRLSGPSRHPMSSSRHTDTSTNKLIITSSLWIQGCSCWLLPKPVSRRGLASNGSILPPSLSSALICQVPSLWTREETHWGASEWSPNTLGIKSQLGFH